MATVGENDLYSSSTENDTDAGIIPLTQQIMKKLTLEGLIEGAK